MTRLRFGQPQSQAGGNTSAASDKSTTDEETDNKMLVNLADLSDQGLYSTRHCVETMGQRLDALVASVSRLDATTIVYMLHNEVCDVTL